MARRTRRGTSCRSSTEDAASAAMPGLQNAVDRLPCDLDAALHRSVLHDRLLHPSELGARRVRAREGAVADVQFLADREQARFVVGHHVWQRQPAYREALAADHDERWTAPGLEHLDGRALR